MTGSPKGVLQRNQQHFETQEDTDTESLTASGREEVLVELNRVITLQNLFDRDRGRNAT